MRKLTAADKKRKEELASKMDQAKANLQASVDLYNKEVEKLFDDLKLSVAAYNEVREEVNDFMADISREIEDYIDQRSEQWHETDAATYMDEFKTEWDETIDEVEFSDPEQAEVDDDFVPGGDYLRDKKDECES